MVSLSLNKYLCTVYSMKTIMIRDNVYNMLIDLKDERSFSETIEFLVKNNNEIRKKRLMKYAGFLSDKEVNILHDIIKEVRKNAMFRTFG